MLKLGIPSKGRLQQLTVDWFAARGITVARTGSDREYAGQVTGAQCWQARRQGACCAGNPASLRFGFPALC